MISYDFAVPIGNLFQSQGDDFTAGASVRGGDDERRRIFNSVVFDYLTAEQASSSAVWVEQEWIDFPDSKLLKLIPSDKNISF
jgi:hypothetical protein